MRIAVVGSRGTWTDCYGLIDENIPAGCSEIVSGGASGVNEQARRYASDHHIRYTGFLPDYEQFGRAAPIMRNRLLVEYSDYVLAFWDGKSRGTQSVIGECLKNGKPFKMILLNGDDHKILQK